MERADIMAAMGDLKLYGMRAAYDELMAVAVRRQHEPRQIVGDLLAAEINEKKARSVKYQITTAKLSTSAFERLAAGRRTVDQVTYTVGGGDEAVARRVLASLSFTP